MRDIVPGDLCSSNWEAPSIYDVAIFDDRDNVWRSTLDAERRPLRRGTPVIVVSRTHHSMALSQAGVYEPAFCLTPDWMGWTTVEALIGEVAWDDGRETTGIGRAEAARKQ